MAKSARQTYYDAKALSFAEHYGIILYKVEGRFMIYNVSYPPYLTNRGYTIQHTVNLDTMQETTVMLSRFLKKFLCNRR